MHYLNKQFTYTNPDAYDKRSAHPVEQYVRRCWQPLLHDVIREYIDENTTVCDLGCGTLEHTKYMSGAAHIWAVDTNEVMVYFGIQKIKNFRKKVTILIEDALHTSIPPASCSLIWTIGLSEYVPLIALFKEISRIATPKSVLIIQFPNQHSPYNLLIRILLLVLNRPVKKFRNVHEIKKAALMSGWKLMQVESRGMVLPAPTFIARILTPLWYAVEFVCKPIQQKLPIGINVLCVFEKNG